MGAGVMQLGYGLADIGGKGNAVRGRSGGHRGAGVRIVWRTLRAVVIQLGDGLADIWVAGVIHLGDGLADIGGSSDPVGEAVWRTFGARSNTIRGGLADIGGSCNTVRGRSGGHWGGSGNTVRGRPAGH